ncbi:tryptophan synthase subunit alpha [Anaerotruncus colihominis]|uniref:tryptophan synthase n=1 Tax=Anaerotruncus colihominis TaxID=169435 RepID=A0A3E3IP80_9FIRM|nr:tryptophan synthase subunit alpha [Anaerotruncus colihominis]RGE68877.1 tryptophan synthase subunit alpha [Anaerotruncus colihominis]
MNLICYLSNGYPTIESSKEMALRYVDAGCDIIEIDFPAHDPYLESEYIAGRMAAALEACSDYTAYMDGMAEMKKRLPDTRFILMTYESTVTVIGYERFIAFCKAQGFEDIILVGQQGDAVKNRFIADGMRVSCYVQFQMLSDEVESAKQSNGFVYMQGKPGAGQTNPDFPTLKDCIDHLRTQGITRPIYCGVGIHTPADAKMAREAGADGVFVGSAVLRLHDDPAAMTKMIQDFKREC